MSEEIVFYHNPMSRGRMVHWMLEEIGAPYRFELVSFDKGEHKKAAFLAINPMGKFPAIVHRGAVITETGAIITYLADAFPAALLDRMLARPPPEKTMAVRYGKYDDVVNAVKKALTPGPYLLGDRFSAADVYLGSQLGFGLMTKSLEPRPVFQSYLGTLSQRPAYKRFNQQSDSLAAQMAG